MLLYGNGGTRDFLAAIGFHLSQAIFWNILLLLPFLLLRLLVHSSLTTTFLVGGLRVAESMESADHQESTPSAAFFI